MTYLTERQAAHLIEHLSDLPRLATATIDGAPGGSTVASAAPPGVDLNRVDAGREQPYLLAKITECVRVVFEEIPSTRRRELAEKPTWTSETAWLIGTAGAWQGDDWCAEWIDSGVREVRNSLIGLIEATNHHRTCGICGSPVKAYRVGDYAMAECEHCQRILGMVEVGYEARIKAARDFLKELGRIA